jgi:hypothetical protein
MRAQKAAKGILIQNEWPDAVSYLVECECTDPDHAHSVWVEREKDMNAVTVTIYTKSTTPFWSRSRWRDMWQLLTKGYVKREVAVILNEQQAINYAAAITRTVKKLKQT